LSNAGTILKKCSLNIVKYLHKNNAFLPFTTLHGMQMWSSDENSVYPSVSSMHDL